MRFCDSGDGLMRIGIVGNLRREFHAAKRIGGEVLNVVGEKLVVADKGVNVIGRENRGHEQANFLHRAGSAAASDEVADFERAQNNQKHTCCEVGQQTAPSRADR